MGLIWSDVDAAHSGRTVKKCEATERLLISEGLPIESGPYVLASEICREICRDVGIILQVTEGMVGAIELPKVLRHRIEDRDYEGRPRSGIFILRVWRV